MEFHEISNQFLSAEEAWEISQYKKLKLSQESIQNIQKCKTYLDQKLENTHQPIYGINTGFGSLYHQKINTQDLAKLQHNLVVSHACGTGDMVPKSLVKLMMLLKVQGLSYGHSGVALATVQRLVDLYNLDLIPVVYQQGSLGASGDLAPLAHLSLTLIGLGEMYVDDEVKSTAETLEQHQLEPLTLEAKEGLALLNGTQFMSAYAVWTLNKAKKLSNWADVVGAISLDAFDGRIEPFNPHVHEIRNHKGQIRTAEKFRELLSGSELIQQHKQHVQDPYSFRCIPQVHGATKDTLDYIQTVVESEINAVTDNPTIFPDQDLIISAGNFHGQPLALILDQLAIAVAELGNISERRTYQLISGLRGLPAFLVANPGLNSGFMIPQYTAASIVSQNKQLCTPASVDSIVSSNGQEDHVSMGANAATKAHRIVDNTERVLAIEFMNACQALELRRPLKSSQKIESLHNEYRKSVSFVQQDQQLDLLIKNSIKFMQQTNLNN